MILSCVFRLEASSADQCVMHSDVVLLLILELVISLINSCFLLGNIVVFKFS